MKIKNLILPMIAACGLTNANAAVTAHWTLNEGAGTTTTEQASGQTSNDFGAGVTWSGAVPAAGTSLNPWSLDFTNQTGGSVTTNLTGTDVGVVGTGAKTFVAWINTTSTENDGLIGYSPGAGGTAGGDLRLAIDGGELRFEVSSGFSTGTVNVNTGSWLLVAAVIPANSTINDVLFYVGGADLSPSSFGTGTGGNGRIINTIASGVGSSNILLGDYGNTTKAFTGQMNQAWIFNEALTHEQLDALRIPEPSAFLLGGLALTGLLRRRHR